MSEPAIPEALAPVSLDLDFDNVCRHVGLLQRRPRADKMNMITTMRPTR